MVEKSQLEVLQSDIQRLKDKFTPLLKAETDKFIQIACNYIQGSWANISKAAPATVISELMKAAQMSLFVDGQEAAIVSYAEKAKLMVMYKGLLKMVRNSGELASINAGVSYEKDTFESYTDEKGEHLKHTPLFGKDRGKPVLTYCIARTKGNKEAYVEIMTEEEIQSCRKVSRAGTDSPWNGPFADEMRKKTIIRRISKRLPMSTDLNMAINDDEPIEEEVAPTQEPEEKTQSTRLESAMGVEQPKAHTPEEAEQTFSQVIQGVIETINVKDNPAAKDKNKTRRYSVLIDKKWYGTFDLTMYKKLEEFYNRKSVISLTFVAKMNSATPPVPYNDVLDAVELVASEEVPI